MLSFLKKIFGAKPVAESTAPYKVEGSEHFPFPKTVAEEKKPVAKKPAVKKPRAPRKPKAQLTKKYLTSPMPSMMTKNTELAMRPKLLRVQQAQALLTQPAIKIVYKGTTGMWGTVAANITADTTLQAQAKTSAQNLVRLLCQSCRTYCITS